MSTVSYIESQRLALAQLESFESALTSILVAPLSKAHRERLASETRASDMLDRIVNRSRDLLEMYEDKYEQRRAEVEALSGGGVAGADVTEFYQRLANLKDYHRRYPEAASRVTDVDPVDFAELEGVGIVDGRDCALLLLPFPPFPGWP
jgi:splicing factor 3A subunit 3